MAGVKKPVASQVETNVHGKQIDAYSMNDEQRAAHGLPPQQETPDPRLHPAYAMVDFVKPVAMRDERGQEVRVNRVRLGASVERESPMRVMSIVLNGTWFDVTLAMEAAVGRMAQSKVYRVHVTNTVSAER